MIEGHGLKLIATSVVRGANQGQSHGGIYLIDIERNHFNQVVDWNQAGIDWQGRGWDRGLRGIAISGEDIYVAASDELFVYDPDFTIQRSFRNPYLRHCHEICCFGGLLYLTSTGFDSILVFDIERQDFSSGTQLAMNSSTLAIARFDPKDENGPAERNLLHLNNVVVNQDGIYVSGMRTGGLFHINGQSETRRVFKLPSGIHNAQPHLDGVLFNDTGSDLLRYLAPAGREVRFKVPQYAQDTLTHTEFGDKKVARQGFGRGLCVSGDGLVAAGSSPSTVCLYDIQAGRKLAQINFSMDVRNAIHGLEVWPF